VGCTHARTARTARTRQAGRQAGTHTHTHTAHTKRARPRADACMHAGMRGGKWKLIAGAGGTAVVVQQHDEGGQQVTCKRGDGAKVGMTE
jgi:hypothetical protein